MSLKLNLRNSRALEGPRALQLTCAEPNFDFCVPLLTTSQTCDTLTNSGHTVWAIFALKFYVPSTIHHVACAERNTLRAPERSYAVPNLEFRVLSLPTIPTWPYKLKVNWTVFYGHVLSFLPISVGLNGEASCLLYDFQGDLLLQCYLVQWHA